MIDRPFIFAGIFSLSLHGVLASFLLPSLQKVPSDEINAMSVMWVSCLKEPAVKTRKSKKTPLSNSIPQPHKASLPRAVEGNQSNKGNDKDHSSGVFKTASQSISPRKNYQPLPEYPWVCRKRHQEGTVTIRLKTDQMGHVIETTLRNSSGHERLDEVALQAIKSWIFAEGPFQKTLSIAFRLKE